MCKFLNEKQNVQQVFIYSQLAFTQSALTLLDYSLEITEGTRNKIKQVLFCSCWLFRNREKKKHNNIARRHIEISRIDKYCFSLLARKLRHSDTHQRLLSHKK